MSAQKQAGTREETRVVEWLKSHGWPKARRIAPGGTSDKGDVEWTTGVIVEVKHRRTTTSNAGLGQPGPLELAGWMAELEAERKNSGADFGWLIVKRSGTTDVGQWWAYIPSWALADLWGVQPNWLACHALGEETVCMSVNTANKIMTTSGFVPVPL